MSLERYLAPNNKEEKEKHVKWEVKDAQIMSWILGNCSIRPPKKFETSYNVSVGSSNGPSPSHSSITPEMVQQMIVSAFYALGLSGSNVWEDDREGA
ncbi:hypothetical protein HRI_002657900 [Hibiscus trionum]|uniref:Uncharacterized protein n=1 Tax=Hibiscus trionum TaxID=183268 RepID=A0A9W7M725_HIBTR|nr:hypothetical protein HRI_002657900 [Hibiscus trionum]